MKPPHPISPAESDDDLLRQIGRVAVQWAILERLLTSAIARLSKLDEQRAVCMFYNLNASTKIDILSCLVAEFIPKDDPRYEEVIQLIALIIAMQEERNNHQHCVLGEAVDGKYDYVKIITRGGKGIKRKQIEICADDAKKTADQLAAICVALASIVEKATE